MAGPFVIDVCALYVWIAYKLLRSTRPLCSKALIVVAILLVATADAYYGRIKLERLCATSAAEDLPTAEGIHRFYDDVERAVGFYDDGFTKGAR